MKHSLLGRTPRRHAALVGLTVLLSSWLGPAALPAAGLAEDEMQVLVYTRTTGFRHLSIPDGVAAIQQLGGEHGFGVDHSEDPNAFTDENLAGYDVVIFLNTTGDPVEDTGQAAFERWVRAGGGWMGIHSAADTEYDWPFYGELLGGAWFLAHPPQQPGVIVNEAPDHPATAHLPEQWPIVDEFYSFQRNPRDGVEVLLSIDETTYLQDPNTSCLAGFSDLENTCETGVMGDHPMSWCVNIDEGRSFYTALGHESYLYSVPDYLEHLWGGIQTAAQRVEADCGPVRPGDGDGAASAESDPGEVTADGLAEAAELPASGGGVALAAMGMLVGGLAAMRRRRHV